MLVVIMEIEGHHFQEIKALALQGVSLEDIRQMLLGKGFSNDHIEPLLERLQKAIKYKKQRGVGFNLLLAGTAVCIASCVLTFFHDYSAVYAAVTLYGLTLLGACLLLAGLAMVLGI